MDWIELSIDTPNEFVEPISQIFLRYANTDIAIIENIEYHPDEGETKPNNYSVTIKTYIEENQKSDSICTQIDIATRLIRYISPVGVLRIRKIGNKDWKNYWKTQFSNINIGKNLVISPTWQKYTPKEKEIVIKLDPDIAFGTGYHPTTNMCLQLLESNIKTGMKVVDIGCGSGILSIASIKLGAKRVVGIDIDPNAIKVSKQNSILNSTSNNSQFLKGTLTDLSLDLKSFDIFVINISSKIFKELASHIRNHIPENSKIIISGILEENENEIQKELKFLKFNILSNNPLEGWVTMIAEKVDNA